MYWMHWRGDPTFNKYVDEYVTNRMAAEYGVHVIAIDGQGGDIYNKLLLEKQAGFEKKDCYT